MGDATDARLSEPRKINIKLHPNWGHASAQQPNRISGDSDWDYIHLVTCVDEVSEQCEVRRTFDKAPHVPVAGASAALVFHEKF